MKSSVAFCSSFVAFEFIAKKFSVPMQILDFLHLAHGLYVINDCLPDFCHIYRPFHGDYNRASNAFQDKNKEFLYFFVDKFGNAEYNGGRFQQR